MAIVWHDVNEYSMVLPVAGSQAILNDAQVEMVPFPGIVRAIFARLDVAGVTGTQVTDVRLSTSSASQTSIFSGSTKINFASTSRSPTYGALSNNQQAVSKGDTFSLNTTGVHSGTAGKGLVVYITIRRGRASGQGTDTDTVSLASDAI